MGSSVTGGPEFRGSRVVPLSEVPHFHVQIHPTENLLLNQNKQTKWLPLFD